MPQFAPSEAKTAIAPITVRPAGLSCDVEIFLGPNDTTKVATSGRIPFVSTGASQNVRLLIAMPATEGTYHAYIDVHAEDYLIATYQAIEDVVIAPVGAAEFVYVSDIRIYPLGEIWQLRMEVDIQNISSVPGVCSVMMYNDWDFRTGAWAGWRLLQKVDPAERVQLWEAMLQPREIKTFYAEAGVSSYIGMSKRRFKVEGDPGILISGIYPREI